MNAFASLDKLIDLALNEDIASGDITSLATIPESSVLEAVILSRQDLVVCGVDIASEVFAKVDSRVQFEGKQTDGEFVSANTVICQMRGPGRSILSAERTALNFMQRLSGIASLTREMSVLANNPSVQLRDTRKTTPAWRELEKYAVRVGGGANHRMGLFDAFLIKNNHVDAVGGDIATAIKRCRELGLRDAKLQVEVRDEMELRAALEENPDSILLDNMDTVALRKMVQIVRVELGNQAVELEASGGVTRKSVTAIAQTGVDAISLGMLTHSATAADLSLRYVGDGE